MDVVVAIGAEPVQPFLSTLLGCTPNRDLYFYVASGHGKSHSLTQHKFNASRLSEWLSMHRGRVHVSEVANTWSGTEASAFILHIVTHYHDLAAKTVFLHGHGSSWHSDPVCSLIRRSEVARPDVGFLNINRPFPKRCLSPSPVFGPSVSAAVRDRYYQNWRLWTNSTPPKRITFECCAQFVATRTAIHKRPLDAWTRILRAIVHDRLGNNWEYLWPTLIDEDQATATDVCR